MYRQSTLSKSDEEFDAVSSYFMSTLGAASTKIHSITRLAGAGRDRFKSGSGQRLMFHGCKCLQNERAIMSGGFAVSACVSGGRNYGTWFAFSAAYSDSGFAFNDAEGIRHMFVCVVSNASVVMQNETMRVVGQNCAYPCWIVKYVHGSSRQAHTFNVGPYGRWVAPGAAALALPPVARPKRGAKKK
eukprot:SRR837773.23897.p2 GENE.SRR837773.23897~~SRR837773.23897.p2  ORF type:complete len:211 (-),score=27.13 SRR837773.23897:86-646(-)